MVRNLSDDREFADAFSKRLSGRCLIKILTVLRTREGLSQAELADKLGCKQSKVSKMESGDDADLRFGDLVNFTGAVGHEMRILLVPEGQSLVDEVKMHAFIIKRFLDRLVSLAGEDNEIVEGVADFLEEATFNLTRMVKKAAAALPPLPEEPPRLLQVDAPEVEEEPVRPRRPASRPTGCAASAAVG